MLILRVAFAAMLLLLTGCATLVRAPQSTLAPPATGQPQQEPVEAWARVLARFVDSSGRVDFVGLAADRTDLDNYVAWVYAVSPATAPERFPNRAAVLAYHLNAYNALAMYNVIEAGLPDTLAGFRKVPFFFLRQIKVGGQALSLSAYEKQIIIPLGDVRVHFALNCMSVGCPRLPRVAFRADALDEQLEHEARAFFADPKNLQVDDVQQHVRVSEILKFYQADFLNAAPTLIDFINRYREPAIPLSWSVDFIPYDWTINQQPKR